MLELGRETAWRAVGGATAAVAGGSRAGGEAVVEAVVEGDATGGAVVGSPKGVGARRGRVLFEKGREKPEKKPKSHFRSFCALLVG